MTPDVAALIDELDRLAEKATPGERKVAIPSLGAPSVIVTKNGKEYFIADFRTKFIHFGESGKEWEDLESESIAAANLFAALDPATVRLLTAEIRRLRGEVDGAEFPGNEELLWRIVTEPPGELSLCVANLKQAMLCLESNDQSGVAGNLRAAMRRYGHLYPDKQAREAIEMVAKFYGFDITDKAATRLAGPGGQDHAK